MNILYKKILHLVVISFYLQFFSGCQESEKENVKIKKNWPQVVKLLTEYAQENNDCKWMPKYEDIVEAYQLEKQESNILLKMYGLESAVSEIHVFFLEFSTYCNSKSDFVSVYIILDKREAEGQKFKVISVGIEED